MLQKIRSRTSVGFSLALSLTLPLLGGASSLSGQEGATAAEPTPLETADAAWTARAEGSPGLRAAPGPIARIVELYGDELERSPTDLVVRGRLIRALFYQGEYAVDARDRKLEIFTRAQTVGEEGLDQLAERVGGRDALDEMTPEQIGARLGDVVGAADVYYWTGVAWGLWGRHRGPIPAARQGVAGKIRDYAERTIALDEELENAGGRRLLGQLHAEAPKIPIFTGWIDRKLAIRELEAAAKAFPEDLLSRYYLGKALYEHDKRSRERALELLHSVVGSTPNPGWLIEERVVIDDARNYLAEISG